MRHRIREYNRALAPETNRKFRQVHQGIKTVWTGGTTIDVWVYDFEENRDGKLTKLEADWINERAPEWND